MFQGVVLLAALAITQVERRSVRSTDQATVSDVLLSASSGPDPVST
jgi:hypothetical protein